MPTSVAVSRPVCMTPQPRGTQGEVAAVWHGEEVANRVQVAGCGCMVVGASTHTHTHTEPPPPKHLTVTHPLSRYV